MKSLKKVINQVNQKSKDKSNLSYQHSMNNLHSRRYKVNRSVSRSDRSRDNSQFSDVRMFKGENDKQDKTSTQRHFGVKIEDRDPSSKRKQLFQVQKSPSHSRSRISSKTPNYSPKRYYISSSNKQRRLRKQLTTLDSSPFKLTEKSFQNLSKKLALNTYKSNKVMDRPLPMALGLNQSGINEYKNNDRSLGFIKSYSYTNQCEQSPLKMNLALDRILGSSQKQKLLNLIEKSQSMSQKDLSGSNVDIKDGPLTLKKLTSM